MNIKQNFVSREAIAAELQKFYERPITRVSFELVLSIVVVAFFALFALRPTLLTMSKLLKEIEDKTKIEDALNKKVSALGTAQNEYATYERRFTILDQAVHSEVSLEDVLFYLEYLVARENISLAGLRIQEFPLGSGTTPTGEEKPSQTESRSAKNKALTSYTVTVSFSGDYLNIIKFFRTLESIRPLFSVQGYSFTVRETRDKGSVLNATATILLYSYAPPKQSGEVKPAAAKAVTEKPVEEEPAL